MIQFSCYLPQCSLYDQNGGKRGRLGKGERGVPTFSDIFSLRVEGKKKVGAGPSVLNSAFSAYPLTFSWKKDNKRDEKNGEEPPTPTIWQS